MEVEELQGRRRDAEVAAAAAERRVADLEQRRNELHEERLVRSCACVDGTCVWRAVSCGIMSPRVCGSGGVLVLHATTHKRSGSVSHKNNAGVQVALQYSLSHKANPSYTTGSATGQYVAPQCSLCGTADGCPEWRGMACNSDLFLCRSSRLTRRRWQSSRQTCRGASVSSRPLRPPPQRPAASLPSSKKSSAAWSSSCRCETHPHPCTCTPAAACGGLAQVLDPDWHQRALATFKPLNLRGRIARPASSPACHA